MKMVMILSCLILIFTTLTQITEEMGLHTFDSIRSTHGLLIFSINQLVWFIGVFRGLVKEKK